MTDTGIAIVCGTSALIAFLALSSWGDAEQRRERIALAKAGVDLLKLECVRQSGRSESRLRQCLQLATPNESESAG